MDATTYLASAGVHSQSNNACADGDVRRNHLVFRTLAKAANSLASRRRKGEIFG